ncbi:MAG: hypothetical protein H7A46_21470 [Verrucomicrobiales bacterium]|nr:hypothetical protein [Verrucomicrobiales bacterium]
MADIDIDKIAQAHRQIGRVLLHDWDPIGVARVPEGRNEYDGYVRGVYDVAAETRSAQAVAQHLLKVEREHMALRGCRRWKSLLPVAERILELMPEANQVP